jgi:hypothetical protein
MNEKLFKELALQAGGSHYPNVGGETLKQYTRLVVEACIDAVENTSRTHAHTTFDKSLVDATIDKSAQAIRDKFELPLIRKMPHEDSTMQRLAPGVSGYSPQERGNR